MTVFNLKSFEATEGVIQKPIISTSLFQLILDNNETQKETVSVTKKQDTLNSLVREFLLHSYLVKLDRTYDNVSNYFQDIASFSSFEVNPELEECYYDLLDELSSSPTTISEISKNIEHEMANETNPGEQTLNTLSEYSQQSQYIKGLQEIAAKIRKCASNTYDFYYMYRVYFELLSEIREHRPSTDEIIQNPQTFVNFFCECSEKFSEIEKKKISSRKIKNLFYVLMYDTKAWETFISQPSLVEYDKEIQRFVSEESESLLCYHQLDFLDIYKEDKSKLEMFNSEFKLAFECAQPFERISHIHSAYEILGGLLRLQDIGEIGADQIVPFALLATVYANPLGLASTGNFIAEFISPLLSGNSPVDHAEEYSLVQFLSTFRFLEEKYNEKKKANENK
ncbi:hypothetical protein GPJ56_008986 [Histomonas meleagridis]|uniref:uncharacterized protein n=1 Tax=Histomonas meleagridis TaxID=135588 RepID=UPI003559F5B4|nr:hypothetical protein GPJ56_008986 [Histomonas meleagridis]KAH0805658.1 hypothetical protein GO595_001499 [Histomonas meleagridis]